MKDYHFENDNQEFDKTIRLDDINQKVKQIGKTQPHTDDLGDKDEFLNVFQSEHLENIEEKEIEETEQQDTIQPSIWAQQKTENKLPNIPSVHTQDQQPPQSFWNKKTIGFVTLGCIVLLMVCFGLGKLLFDGVGKDSMLTSQEQKPMLVYAVLDDGELLVYDIQQQKQKTVVCTEKTEVYDKGERVFADTIQKGDVLMMALDKDEEIVLTAQYGGNIKQKEVTNVTVNTATHTIKINDTNYVYDTNTMFLYQQNSIEPSRLEPCDVLQINTIGDKIWSANVLEYHGYISVVNKENIKNGMFQLDTQKPIPLAEVGRLAVAEGSHSIMVTGDNIETRTDNILVETGEEYQYDLSKAQEKVGVLVVNTNVTDYKLYINGALVDSTTPTVLPLGEYDVVILKNGYLEWNQTVTIDKDTVTIQAELEEDIQYGSVSIVCNEEGSYVCIDGVEKGVTPMQIDLPYGVYTIEVRKEGFPIYQETVDVKNPIVHVIADLTF